jgi:putative ABC transport system permease protein
MYLSARRQRVKRTFKPNSEKSAPKDVEREIDLHIDLRAREFEAQGMSRDDARRAALAAFGDRAAIADEVTDIRASTVRDRQRRDWLDELRMDLLVGLRILRRTPSFTLVALLTLAIGIGANTAIFGVLRSVLLRPLPYPHAEQLVQVWSDHRAIGRAQPEWLTPPDFVDWRDGNSTFSSMASYQGWFPDLTGNGDPETVGGLLVSGTFFDVLESKPAVGRLITKADDDTSAQRVVVLTHAFWQRRFGGDRSIVGKQLTLNGVPWTVAGILSPEFRSPTPIAPNIIAPARRPPNGGCGRGCIVLRVIGRLKPNVSLAAAQADVGRIAARIAQDYPRTNAKVGAWLIPLHEQITGETKPALITLSVAVAFVLLIGCVNLANLLLVRGAARGREIGVRAALGAGRGRVIRQLLTENLLLAIGGGVLGVGLGVLGTRLLGAVVPATVRDVQDIRVDGTVLAFAAGITLLSALLFGLVPALHAVRAGLMTSLRTSSGQSGRRDNMLRRWLVITQLSFAVVLLVSAGLLMRSFLLMQRVDLGFKSQNVYVTGVTFRAQRYPDGQRALGAIEDMLTRLRANPAIKTAEATDLPPLSGGDQDITAIPVGSAPVQGQPPSIWYRAVTLGYLRALNMRLVAGREFIADDRKGAPLVGVINEEAARRFWPNQNPIGKVLAAGRAADAPRLTVVGVVRSAHHDGPNQPYKTELFLPFAQFPARGVSLVLEPARDVAAMTAAVRQTMHDVDPLIPVGKFDELANLAGSTVELPKLYATLVTLFATAALLLAALGVYGVMSYSVAQRQREIGVRLALGAEPSGIRAMVLGEGGRLAIIGLALGLVGALLAGQLLAKLLFGIGRYDTPTLVTVPLVLGIVTLIASWIPARRAMRLDPVWAIREE